MKAKFPGKCRACGGPIEVNEDIMWKSGEGARHATTARCAEARALMLVEAEASPKLDTAPLKKLADFVGAAKERGLKHPKVRMLAGDGETEIAVGVTANGAAPGSLSIVLGREFIGCVRPNGQVTGQLRSMSDVQQRLIVIADDPVRAAKEYASLKGRCSFCNDEITDEGSVEVGYGPVCAKRYGLPHRAKGTPRIGAVRLEDTVYALGGQ